ncbi:centrosomal protein of 63 kDa-like [Asterias rubens]|uniref:centrosomal protein of 63 kDa-like n=1 Tax=Asterias rubens TaxID=7604 RepID=UPI0014553BE0|nr:centrosomal protein of 63 kDa-like [Asterias rubens]
MFSLEMEGELFKEANDVGLFAGPMTSCEAELQELMRQIDIMVHNRKMEWETELEGVKGQLRSSDKEVMSQRALLEVKHQEVGRLQHQLDSSKEDQRLLTSQYEQKLAQLGTQLSSLQQDYERVQRHHSKQAVGAEKEKSQVTAQFQDTLDELKKAQLAIQEYESKGSGWEIQKRAFKQQIQSLETQRTTMADKLELLKQQAFGYQDQLGKRRQLLEQTEMNFKSRLAHLEGCLTRSQDAVEDKNNVIQRLEKRLDEMEDSRRNEDGERRERDGRFHKMDAHIKHLEDETNHLRCELESRDGLIRSAEQTMKQHKHQLAQMEESLALKDDMIRCLKEDGAQETVHQIHELQYELDEKATETSRLIKAETQLKNETHRLQTRLDESHLECARLNTDLAKKIDELRHLEGSQVKQLKQQLNQAKELSKEQEQHYLSHLDGMRSEVAALTSDLHHRDMTLATLSHKIASAERNEREEAQKSERHQHELQITNAQLDALRIENQSLRDGTGSPDSNTQDMRHAERQLQELKNMHKQHMKESQVLQEENSILQRKLTSMTQQLHDSEVTQQNRYQAVMQESNNKMTQITLEHERKLKILAERHNHDAELLQCQLDTTVLQDDSEISRLRDLCSSLKGKLKEKTHLLNRLQGENNAMAGFVSNVETIATSPPYPSPSSTHRKSSHHSPRHPSSPSSSSIQSPHELSLSSTTPRTRRQSPAARKLFEDDYNAAAMPEILGFPELVIPSNDVDSKRPDSRQSITASFMAEDLRRTKDLEQLLDDHIANLEQQTDDTIHRRRIGGDGGDLLGQENRV